MNLNVFYLITNFLVKFLTSIHFPDDSQEGEGEGEESEGEGEESEGEGEESEGGGEGRRERKARERREYTPWWPWSWGDREIPSRKIFEKTGEMLVLCAGKVTGSAERRTQFEAQTAHATLLYGEGGADNEAREALLALEATRRAEFNRTKAPLQQKERSGMQVDFMAPFSGNHPHPPPPPPDASSDA